MDAMAAAAKKYPDVYFEHATGYKTVEELRRATSERARTRSTSPAWRRARRRRRASSATSSRSRSRRSSGTRTPSRSARRRRIRARRSSSSGRTRWFDPAKEKKAAESLVAAGADVLGQNVDSPAAGQYAQSKELPWVGYDCDAKKFAPTSWLTAAVYNWGPYYLKRVKAAAERHVEDGHLLRQHRRTASRTSPRSARRCRRRRRRDRGQAKAQHRQGHVLRVPGAALRPERASSACRRGSG